MCDTLLVVEIVDLTLFDFNNWDALACYCLDPAGNILELIAHLE